MHGRSVGVLVVAVGCALDPKMDGMGTDAAQGSGSTSLEASGTESSSTTTSPSSSSEEGDSGCADANCVWDPCSDLACGSLCSICAPWDDACIEPDSYAVCRDVDECIPWTEWGEQPCPDHALQPGFEVGLDEEGGCDDMFVAATNEDNTRALFVRVDGVIEQTRNAGLQSLMLEYAGNDPAVEITATSGSYLLQRSPCNDFITMEPVIEEQWRAGALADGAAGTVTIELTLREHPYFADATVTLDDVVLVREGDELGPPIVIEHRVLADVYVGWMPG